MFGQYTQVVLIFTMVNMMSAKINILKIISGHLNTLKDATTNKISIQDYGTFFIVPLLFSILFYFLSYQLSDHITTLLVTFGAIFTPLLLSVLVLVYEQSEKLNNKKSEDFEYRLNIKKQLLKELFSNICYAILVSMALVFMCFIDTIIGNLKLNIIPIISPIVVFLTLNLFLTILMVVKRLYSLLIAD